MSEEQLWEQLADRELVQQALSPASPPHREAALRAIYDRHSADVLGLCGYWLHDPDAALDAAQATFETAIEDLTGAGPAGAPTLRDPDKLGAWLHGIAKNHCRAVWRHRDRDGEFPEQDLEDAEHEVKASRRRRAEVDRMLDVIATSFTDRQRTVFQCVLRQGVRGQALAAQLGVSDKEAHDVTYENQGLVADGFGAYVLARDGRGYCAGLGRILDQTGWDGQTFTRVLRLRILRHLDRCPKLCDDCRTCNPRKWKLMAVYAPVTVPILIGAELRDRIYLLIHRVCLPPGSTGPGSQAQGGPTAAASGATAGTPARASLDAVISHDAPEVTGRARPPARRQLRIGGRAVIGTRAAVVIGAGTAVIAAAAVGAYLGATGPSPHPALASSKKAAPTSAAAGSTTLAGPGTDCGSAGMNSGNGQWDVVVARGHISCAAAIRTINTYSSDLSNTTMEQSGSGGFVNFGGWQCSHQSYAEIQSTGQDATCAQSDVTVETRLRSQR